MNFFKKGQMTCKHATNEFQKPKKSKPQALVQNLARKLADLNLRETFPVPTARLLQAIVSRFTSHPQTKP